MKITPLIAALAQPTPSPWLRVEIGEKLTTVTSATAQYVVPTSQQK